MADDKRGIQPTTYVLYKGDTASPVESAVIEETLVCISINGQELATFMCTPYRLEELALGFLRSEGFIQSLADIEVLHLSESKTCVDIWLRDLSFTPPKRQIITSAAAGALPSTTSASPPASEYRSQHLPAQVATLMQQLHLAAKLYQEVRGVHTSALSDGQELLLVARMSGGIIPLTGCGPALQQGLRPRPHLLASGRISSEMITRRPK